MINLDTITKLHNSTLCNELQLPSTPNTSQVSMYNMLKDRLVNPHQARYGNSVWSENSIWSKQLMHKNSKFSSILSIEYDINAFKFNNLLPIATPKDYLVISNNMHHLPYNIQIFIMEHIDKLMYYYIEYSRRLPLDIAISRAVDKLIECNIYSLIHYGHGDLPNHLSRRYKELQDHYKAGHSS